MTANAVSNPIGLNPLPFFPQDDAEQFTATFHRGLIPPARNPSSDEVADG